MIFVKWHRIKARRRIYTDWHIMGHDGKTLCGHRFPENRREGSIVAGKVCGLCQRSTPARIPGQGLDAAYARLRNEAN